MRPFGGLLFGYLGDRYGRVYSLRVSLLAMVVPTVLFGVLPGYASLGLAATVLIFLLRVVQGLCVGGEMSTALVYIFEKAPPHLKATLVGYLFAMSCGSYLALVVYMAWAGSGRVVEHSTQAWTWRLAFVSTAFIGIFGAFLRKLLLRA